MSVHYFDIAILVLAPLSEEQLQMRNCALLMWHYHALLSSMERKGQNLFIILFNFSHFLLYPAADVVWYFRFELNWRPLFSALENKNTPVMWPSGSWSAAPLTLKRSLQFVDPLVVLCCWHCVPGQPLSPSSPPFLSLPGTTKQKPCNCILSSPQPPPKTVLTVQRDRTSLTSPSEAVSRCSWPQLPLPPPEAAWSASLFGRSWSQQRFSSYLLHVAASSVRLCFAKKPKHTVFFFQSKIKPKD